MKPFEYRRHDPLYPGDYVEVKVSRKNADASPPKLGYANGKRRLYFYKCIKAGDKLKLSFIMSYIDMTFEKLCIEMLLHKGKELDASKFLPMLGPDGKLAEEW